MINITPIIEIILSLAVALVTAFLIPYIKSKIDEGKWSKLNTLAFWLEKAVLAVEEADRKGIIDKSEKYNAVAEFLREKGFELDVESVRTLIDGSVYELINQFKSDMEV